MDEIEDILVEIVWNIDTAARIKNLRKLGLVNIRIENTAIVFDNPGSGARGGIGEGYYDPSAWVPVVITLSPRLFGDLPNLNTKLDAKQREYKKNHGKARK